ncbi:uncharacterized protein LOC119387780 [Rhipicephalus sanguineus]|uniref:uncharacterized protein LOC119387780 n=1 Tax=Rhipicephalus sanguineus TaxID=34632 RepID=UPI001895782F|nr:uncharacterized protein LOC119387780 [Rhipicephalus sanguineus]
MDGSGFPGLARTLLLLLVAITFLPDRTCVVTATKPPLLCEMPREMKVHLIMCAERILQRHVVTLLAKRSKRLFKGRNLVDAITDMCVDRSHIINNNVALTVMQVPDVDKNYTEYALWNCMNTTRYLMLYGGS